MKPKKIIARNILVYDFENYLHLVPGAYGTMLNPIKCIVLVEIFACVCECTLFRASTYHFHLLNGFRFCTNYLFTQFVFMLFAMCRCRYRSLAACFPFFFSLLRSLETFSVRTSCATAAAAFQNRENRRRTTFANAARHQN